MHIANFVSDPLVTFAANSHKKSNKISSANVKNSGLKVPNLGLKISKFHLFTKDHKLVAECRELRQKFKFGIQLIFKF